MTLLWGILSTVATGAAGFFVGARFVGGNLAKILAKFSDAQLVKLADEVSKERERGHTG